MHTNVREELFHPAPRTRLQDIGDKFSFGESALGSAGRVRNTPGLYQRQAFNLNDLNHTQLLEQTTRDAQETLHTLKMIDTSIAISAVVALLTFTLMPWFTVCVVAASVCAYNTAARAQAVENQQQALKNLMMSWDWAMNASPQQANEIQNHPIILEARRVLFPLLTTEEFRDITANNVEDAQIEAAGAAIDAPLADNMVENHLFKTLGATDYVEIQRETYGYNKDFSFFTWMKGLSHAFPHAMQQASEGVSTVVKMGMSAVN